MQLISNLFKLVVPMQVHEDTEANLVPIMREFFNRATKSIYMASNYLSPTIYSNREILSCIAKLRKNEESRVEFIFSENAISTSLESLVALQAIKVKIFKAIKPIRGNFGVIDNKHLILEDPYHPDDTTRKLRIFLNTSVAQEAAQNFQVLKSDASVLENVLSDWRGSDLFNGIGGRLSARITPQVAHQLQELQVSAQEIMESA